MWLIPFTVGAKHVVTVDLGSVGAVAGLKIWNYNKSSDDTLRGVRLIEILVDEKIIGKWECRIAPGSDG